MGDYDNDGDVDLYVVYPDAVNRFYRNNENGSFTDVTSSSGAVGGSLGGLPPDEDAAWADFDQDGDLDLFLSYRGTDINQHANQLFRNDQIGSGIRTFVDVAASAHVNDSTNDSVSAKWADYDRDGYPDLYIVNLSGGSHADVLYHNNRNGTFSAANSAAGISEFDSCERAVWDDFNSDGWPDLYCNSSLLTPTERLWLNNRNGTFTDISTTSGIRTPVCAAHSVTTLDKDNDGDIDIYDGCDGTDRLMENDGSNPPHFVNVASTSGIVETGDFDASYAVAAADFNNDRRVDVLSTGINSDDDRLWVNTSNANQGLTIRLLGTTSNKWGVGARITAIPDVGTATPTEQTCLDADGTPTARHQEVLGGSHSQNSIESEVGLGTRAINVRQVDCLNVHWPRSGLTRSYSALATDQVVEVSEDFPNTKVTRVVPASGPTSGGTTVTIYGFQFGSNPTVDFDGIFANIQTVGPGKITCTAPPHPKGFSAVHVTNPQAGQADALPNGYEYYEPDEELVLTVTKNVLFSAVHLAWTDLSNGSAYRVLKKYCPQPDKDWRICTPSFQGQRYYDDYKELLQPATFYYLVDHGPANCPPIDGDCPSPY